MATKVCKRCQTYLLDHDDYTLRFHGWKKCPSCAWCCDKEGYNLIDKKPDKALEEFNTWEQNHQAKATDTTTVFKDLRRKRNSNYSEN